MKSNAGNKPPFIEPETKKPCGHLMRSAQFRAIKSELRFLKANLDSSKAVHIKVLDCEKPKIQTTHTHTANFDCGNLTVAINV